MIFDTDVLIWYFRGNESARKVFHAEKSVAVSAVNVMELIQGIKNKEELRLINKFLRVNDIHIYTINEEITFHAMHLLEEYALSDGMQWGDALIAATALHYGENILTANFKHYRFISSLEVKKFIPH